ncbi:MAG: 1-phosphofructokinase [Bacteroidetes bacterium]|nr:1-phosphofructokinase [Bacteroidota bacterium]MBU1117168.1 1-phosphofructokinase [Bacteroidota bacterium]MBU1798560.1 1-phosphofructokinase [Bacteroidota bacterium]
MVLTVTLNPLLENRTEFDAIKLGKVSRGINKEYRAGGKGINVCRQLDYLEIKNVALLPLGGNNGKMLRKVLIDENMNFTSISSKGETRAATLAIEKSKKRITSLFEPSEKLTENEINEFKTKFIKMIQNCSIVVFSGSVPNKDAASIITYGIELANELDKFSILDTYGEHLQDCINAKPSVIHNNINELENSLGIELNSEDKKVEFLKELYNKGIKLAFITDGANATYASKFDFIYKIQSKKVKEIDSTGSGDAFVAGITYGLEKSMVFDKFVRVAAALGSVNATKWDVCTTRLEEIENIIDSVIVSQIGKKFKLIDDSPTHS